MNGIPESSHSGIPVHIQGQRQRRTAARLITRCAYSGSPGTRALLCSCRTHRGDVSPPAVCPGLTQSIVAPSPRHRRCKTVNSLIRLVPIDCFVGLRRGTAHVRSNVGADQKCRLASPPPSGQDGDSRKPGTPDRTQLRSPRGIEPHRGTGAPSDGGCQL